MNKLFLSLLVFAQLTGFQSVAQDVIDDIAQVQPLKCATGTSPASFSLVPITKWPTAKKVAAVIPGITQITRAKGNLSFRLDLCGDDNNGAFTLKRVLFHPYSESPIEMYDESNSKFVTVEKLQEALFEQPQGFKVVIRGSDNRGVLIVGAKNTPENFIAAVGIEFMANGKYQPTAISALVGTFFLGDSLSGGPCKIGQDQRTSTVKLGTANLTFDICTFLGGGETTGYTINSLKVTDTNSAIPQNMRGVEQIFEGEALKQALAYRYNHHNACDSFVLKATALKAVYTASSSPAAGCGMTLPGAPERKFDELDTHLGKTLYRTDYNGVKGTVQVLDASHFLKFF
jgi:hypothetical protein